MGYVLLSRLPIFFAVRLLYKKVAWRNGLEKWLTNLRFWFIFIHRQLTLATLEV
jgi:hypothetical protein